MIANIKEPTTLQEVDPDRISKYLKKKGWIEETAENNAGLWLKTNDDNQEIQISVPANKAIANYHLEITKILKSLADVEYRLPVEIFYSLIRDTEAINKYYQK
jgi:hypothetical protein